MASLSSPSIELLNPSLHESASGLVVEMRRAYQSAHTLGWTGSSAQARIRHPLPHIHPDLGLAEQLGIISHGSDCSPLHTFPLLLGWWRPKQQFIRPSS